MDSLLRFDLVLPQTVPVGISNDLMFSAKEHPFMDFIIHRLAQFDHDYRLNCELQSI
jgi:mannosyltransferase OCH1-like enzyme